MVGRLVGLKDWHKWSHDNDSVCCTQSRLRSVVGLVRLERRYVSCTHEDSLIFSLYFYRGRAQDKESKEHCLCIKENKNKSSQSSLRNPSTLKSPLAHVWYHGKIYQMMLKIGVHSHFGQNFSVEFGSLDPPKN